MSSVGQRVRSHVESGSVRLPDEVLAQLDLSAGDVVSITSHNGELIIEKVKQFRVVVGGKDPE